MEWETCGGVAAVATLTYSDTWLPRTTERDMVSLVALFSAREWMTDQDIETELAGDAFGAKVLTKAEKYHGYKPKQLVSGLEAPDLLNVWRENSRAKESIRLMHRLEKRSQIAIKGWEERDRIRAECVEGGILPHLHPEAQKLMLRTQHLDHDTGVLALDNLEKRLAVVGEPSHFVLNQPGAPTLVREHLTAFMRELRRQVKIDFGRKVDIAYHGCGEYGGKKGRPHWHVSLFPRDNPFDWDSETWAAYLLGTQDKLGPIQRAWKYADWKRTPVEAFKRRCEPYDSGTALYIQKYLMKAAKGLHVAQCYETAKPIRADGSAVEFVTGTRSGGGKTDGLGYRAIPKHVNAARHAAGVFISMTEEQRAAVLDVIRKANSGPFDYVENIAANKALANLGVSQEMADAAVDVYRIENEWWPYQDGDKKRSIRPPKYWRDKFFEALGITKEARQKMRAVDREIIQARESRKTDAVRQYEENKNRQKADQWKAGAVRIGSGESPDA